MRRELVVDDVEVGAADARGDDVKDDVTGPGDRLGPLDERDVVRARRELRDAEHRQFDELVRA
jgi:hypothetical protein